MKNTQRLFERVDKLSARFKIIQLDEKNKLIEFRVGAHTI